MSEPPADRTRAAPTPISACIIALDEEQRLGACLDALAFCDEIVVVDSHSTDRTREIAAAHGARVLERDWPGHVAQKEFAIRAARHDWVLCVDADERVTPELRAQIEQLRCGGLSEAGPAGYDCPRCTYYFGRWIRRGTWYPDRQLRLFDRRRGHWGGHDPHDRVELAGARAHLAGELLHWPYRELSEHLETIDAYTTTMARGLHARGRRASSFDLVVRPLVRFLRFYVLKFGFLEGWRGFWLACVAAHYVRLKYAKLLLLQDPPPAPTTDRKDAAGALRSSSRS